MPNVASLVIGHWDLVILLVKQCRHILLDLFDSAVGHFTVLGIAVNPEKPAAEAFCDDRGGAAAEKGVEH